jgi:hypothetical protein
LDKLQNQFVSFKVSDFANEDEDEAAPTTTTTTTKTKTRSRSFADESEQNNPEPSANPGGGGHNTTNWSNRLSNLTWLPSFNHDDLIKNKCLFFYLFIFCWFFSLNRLKVNGEPSIFLLQNFLLHKL